MEAVEEERRLCPGVGWGLTWLIVGESFGGMERADCSSKLGLDKTLGL